MLGRARIERSVSAVLRSVYPPHCLTCNAIMGTEDGLCGTCWRDTPFITGLSCDLCGAPLPGEDPGGAVHCDDCLRVARPWSRGTAVMAYGQNARRLVLRLKHGDATELARAAGRWMANVSLGLCEVEPLLVPVPLHWRRLLKRKYNQSALLAQALGRETGCACHPDLLRRVRYTRSQDGKSHDARFENLVGAIDVRPERRSLIAGRSVLLVDDVMTSGATFAASAEACLAAGASDVRVIALARVSKDR